MDRDKMPFAKGHHTRIIKMVARGLNEAKKLDNYLELGIRNGRNFNEVARFAKTAYAVDIDKRWYKPIKDNKNLVWFHGATKDFLTSYEGEKFDLIFIDADHKHESSLEDFQLSLPLLKDNGIILIHDTYPTCEELVSYSYCGDTYKTAQWIKDNMLDEVEVVTLPFYYGVSVIRKTKKQLDWMNDE
jgi:hypothetical protein